MQLVAFVAKVVEKRNQLSNDLLYLIEGLLKLINAPGCIPFPLLVLVSKVYDGIALPNFSEPCFEVVDIV